MPTNTYNGAEPELVVIKAGTRLYRIVSTAITYPPNSYNPAPKPLDDPAQGRFEPCTPDLGGYIYVASTISGAVGEGVLRNVDVPSQRLAQRTWLRNKSLVTLQLDDDVRVAAINGPRVNALNLDASLLCAGREHYSRCRQIGSDILTATEECDGLQYTCRTNTEATALMLITRDSCGPSLTLLEESEILRDPACFKLIIETLESDYGLPYLGATPGQH